jgi:hypothetical protein
MNIVKKAGLGLVTVATVLTAAAPAEAQRYHRYRDRDNTGTAIVAGVAGLAIGAAIASNRNDRRYYDRRYDYDRRFYRERGYYPRNGYYYRDYAPRYRGCDVRRVYDPYLRRNVTVRYC